MPQPHTKASPLHDTSPGDRGASLRESINMNPLRRFRDESRLLTSFRNNDSTPAPNRRNMCKTPPPVDLNAIRSPVLAQVNHSTSPISAYAALLQYPRRPPSVVLTSRTRSSLYQRKPTFAKRLFSDFWPVSQIRLGDPAHGSEGEPPDIDLLGPQ